VQICAEFRRQLRGQVRGFTAEKTLTQRLQHSMDGAHRFAR